MNKIFLIFCIAYGTILGGLADRTVKQTALISFIKKEFSRQFPFKDKKHKSPSISLLAQELNAEINELFVPQIIEKIKNVPECTLNQQYSDIKILVSRYSIGYVARKILQESMDQLRRVQRDNTEEFAQKIVDNLMLQVSFSLYSSEPSLLLEKILCECAKRVDVERKKLDIKQWQLHLPAQARL